MDVTFVAQLIVDLLLDLGFDFAYVTEAELVDEIADVLEDNI